MKKTSPTQPRIYVLSHTDKVYRKVKILETKADVWMLENPGRYRDSLKIITKEIEGRIELFQSGETVSQSFNQVKVI